jgi:hypothetical protein
LITKQLDEYHSLIAKYDMQIKAMYNGSLSRFFYVLEMFQRNDLNKMRDGIGTFLKPPNVEKKKYFLWSFDQVVSMASSKPDSARKTLLLTFIHVLNGDISPAEAKTMLSSFQ